MTRFPCYIPDHAKNLLTIKYDSIPYNKLELLIKKYPKRYQY